MAQVVQLTVEEETPATLSVDTDSEATLTAEGIVEVTTSDYTKLNNKPTINAGYPEYTAELVTNYDEVDPTVPAWAKADTKPTYTADEVGAVDVNNEITEASIDAIMAAVFDDSEEE